MPPVYHLRDYLGPGECFHIARGTRSAGQSLPLHGHDFAEIFWITGAPGIYTLNGSEREMTPGELAVIHPGDEHAMRPVRGGAATRGEAWTIRNIAFTGETLRKLMARHPAARLLFARQQVGLPPPRFGAAQVDYLNGCVERLLMLPRDPLALEWLLLSVLLDLQPQTQIELPEAAPAWLRRACQLIVKPAHFAQGPAELARLAHRSPEHLARSTRKWLGQSPGEIITRLRMQFARHQLQSTNAPIKVIAEECGLRNLSHFYRMFEAEHGEAPAAWRRGRAGSQPI